MHSTGHNSFLHFYGQKLPVFLSGFYKMQNGKIAQRQWKVEWTPKVAPNEIDKHHFMYFLSVLNYFTIFLDRGISLFWLLILNSESVWDKRLEWFYFHSRKMYTSLDWSTSPKNNMTERLSFEVRLFGPNTY